MKTQFKLALIVPATLLGAGGCLAIHDFSRFHETVGDDAEGPGMDAGVGPRDAGADASCVPTDEVCNGVSDDCDVAIDESVTCELPNAVAACTEGACEVTRCMGRFLDCTSETGCETDGAARATCTDCETRCPLDAACEESGCVSPQLGWLVEVVSTMPSSPGGAQFVGGGLDASGVASIAFNGPSTTIDGHAIPQTVGLARVPRDYPTSPLSYDRIMVYSGTGDLRLTSFDVFEGGVAVFAGVAEGGHEYLSFPNDVNVRFSPPSERDAFVGVWTTTGEPGWVTTFSGDVDVTGISQYGAGGDVLVIGGFRNGLVINGTSYSTDATGVFRANLRASSGAPSFVRVLLEGLTGPHRSDEYEYSARHVHLGPSASVDGLLVGFSFEDDIVLEGTPVSIAYQPFYALVSPAGDAIYWSRLMTEANTLEQAPPLALGDDGTVVISMSWCGGGASFSCDLGDGTTVPGDAGYVIAVAPDGTTTWARRLDGVQIRNLRRVEDTILASGSLVGRLEVDGDVLNARGPSDAVVVALDVNDGEVLWARRVGGGLRDSAADADLSVFGDLLVMGEFQGAVDVLGTTLVGPNVAHGGFAVRMDHP